jgi:hypothetical protein
MRNAQLSFTKIAVFFTAITNTLPYIVRLCSVILQLRQLIYFIA